MGYEKIYWREIFIFVYKNVYKGVGWSNDCNGNKLNIVMFIKRRVE